MKNLDNSKLDIKEANSFEIKQLICDFKTKHLLDKSDLLSILKENLEETSSYFLGKEYVTEEISILEPGN